MDHPLPLWFGIPSYDTFYVVSENSTGGLGWVLSTFLFSLSGLLFPFIPLSSLSSFPPVGWCGFTLPHPFGEDMG